MKLLGAKLYDPSVAVTKATSALLAMTAMDTTNLRLTVTIPSHGMIRVRIAGVVHGATTFPSILVGVLDGSTVRGRVAPSQRLGNTAVATAMVHWEADFVITGLTPGSMTLDAAYGVETVIASTGIKYGGPNDTTANNAWGGLLFQIYDPDPWPTNHKSLSIDSDGRVDVIKVAGTSQTARDLGANLDAAVSTRLPTASYTAPLDAAGTRTAVGLASASLDTQLAEASGSRLIGSTWTHDQLISTLAGRLCGKRTISGNDRIWRDADDTRNILTITVDTSGQITASTLNPA